MRLIVLGAGGFGQTVADTAEQTGIYDEIRFLDDNSRDPSVLGPCNRFSEYIGENTAFYPAFGNNALRLDWLDRIAEAGGQLAVIIHPRAFCSPRSTLGKGTILLPGAIINTGCQIKRGVIINAGALVDHGCVIEPGAHICLGAIVKAENRIPACLKIEAGAVVGNRTYPL